MMKKLIVILAMTWMFLTTPALAHNHIQCTNADVFLLQIKQMGAQVSLSEPIDENRTKFIFKSDLGLLPTIYYKKQNMFCYFKQFPHQQDPVVGS